VVPYAGALPAPALARLVAQLPADEAISLAEIPARGAKIDFIIGKPAEATWAVIFSSGSSGDPKGVALSGSALQASAKAHAENSGIQNGSWLLNLPIYHVGGFSVIARALFCRGSVIFAAPKFSPEETLAYIREAGVNGLSLVPTALKRLITHDPEFLPPPTLKMVLLGGAGVSPEILTESRRRNWPVFCTYGMTEHCSQIATETFPGSGLRPLPGVEVRIAGDGEILVNSPCLASGYYVAGKFTGLPRTSGFFSTGDLGAVNEGRLSISGRKSELIISGGVNIFPAEVENALARAPGVADCGVVGLPDPEWGEAVCAAIVAANEPFSEESVREFLRGQLDTRKLPKRVFLVPAIPRSPLGKIIRPRLRELLEKNFPSPG
jgi:O-succinylbenzoic acid--CoA ligase